MNDSKTLMAVGVGVGAVALLGLAAYLVSGESRFAVVTGLDAWELKALRKVPDPDFTYSDNDPDAAYWDRAFSSIERKGLMRIIPDPKNPANTLFVLTPEGAKYLETAPPEVDSRAVKRKMMRFLLDEAKTGACGWPQSTSRDEDAETAENIADWSDDVGLAAGEALRDFGVLVRHREDESQQKLCAAGLAEAWRKAQPGRTPRDGDPYTVLSAQPDDPHALLALDQALQLKVDRERLKAIKLGDSVEVTEDAFGAMYTKAPRDLSGAYLAGRDFSKAGLTRTNLTGANLNGAILKKANLSESKLNNATLENADLSGAYLFGTDFQGANLQNANFKYAIMDDNTNFRKANLKNAIFVKEPLLDPKVLRRLKYLKPGR